MLGKKWFAVTAFDLEDEIFVIYIAFHTISKEIYSSCRAYITFLRDNKAPITVFLEYYNIADIFFPKLVVELSKQMEINNYDIDFN